MMNEEEFRGVFAALTGNDRGHFPWQWTLYQRLANGDFPRSCDIPTGLGKTSLVALWLIALANHADKLPRRLVYVVNRRTVVDQTTDEVEKLRGNLDAAELSDSLRNMCAIPLEKGEPPLALSTLRGQFADNREWSADPARPAVIVGTVDMIGSRLLFSGYRVGFKGKPLHAGFLGQDVLLVHDEAHLEPAFEDLIEQIQVEQHERELVGELPWRKLQVMAMTATSRNKVSDSDNSFGLTEAERNPPPEVPDPPTKPVEVVWRRLKAPKTIHLHSLQDEKKDLADAMGGLALSEQFKGSNRAILLFVRTVDNVERVVARLNKEKQRVQQLTGTLRGLERDKLPADPIFARFLPESSRAKVVSPTEGTVYLVCTSAGEVGINISADHLICDLTTFESMGQRFGRVNRFGDSSDTEIHVIHPNELDGKNGYEERRKKTLELLGHVNGDGSTVALSRLDPQSRQDAFAPPPTMLTATDVLFDSWALTSINRPLVPYKLPGRPPVEPYLHGIADWQPPETYVAWREEVGLIVGELLQQQQPEDLLADYPLKPHEQLRDDSSRIFDRLKKLRCHPRTPAWILAEDGSVLVATLDGVIEAGKEALYYRTVLLPPSAGGLREGVLSGDSAMADDVADEWFADKDKLIHRRRRFRSDDPRPGRVKDMRLIRQIDLKLDDEDESAGQALTEEAVQSGAPDHGRYWRWYVRPRSADDDGTKTAQDPVRLDDHTKQVTCYAKRIAVKVAPELQDVIELAARFHDLGKKREVWQRGIGNLNPEDWHAKSGKGWKPRDINENYRHEFGSLLDITAEEDFQRLSD